MNRLSETFPFFSLFQDFENDPKLLQLTTEFLEELVHNTNLLPAEHKAAAQLLHMISKQDQDKTKVDLDILLAPHMVRPRRVRSCPTLPVTSNEPFQRRRPAKKPWSHCRHSRLRKEWPTWTTRYSSPFEASKSSTDPY